MAGNPVRDENTKTVSLQLSAEEIQAGLLAAPQALSVANSAYEKSQSAESKSTSAITIANSANNISNNALSTAKDVQRRANSGEFNGADGKTALYYQVALDYGTNPIVGNQYSSEQKYFSRTPAIGEVFYLTGINNLHSAFLILAQVTAIGQYVDYKILESIPINPLKFSVIRTYDENYMAPDVGTIHEAYVDEFNRLPQVNDVVEFFGYTLNNSYMLTCEITEIVSGEIVDIAKYKITSKHSIKGDVGEKGADGEYIADIIIEEIE